MIVSNIFWVFSKISMQAPEQFFNNENLVVFDATRFSNLFPE